MILGIGEFAVRAYAVDQAWVRALVGCADWRDSKRLVLNVKRGRGALLLALREHLFVRGPQAACFNFCSKKLKKLSEAALSSNFLFGSALCLRFFSAKRFLSKWLAY